LNTLHFAMNTDQDLIPAGLPAQRIIEMIVQAPQAMVKSHRPPLNLALVIDRSGSMSGEKLVYVKQAALHVLDLLQAQDRAALVAFDDEINLLAPSMPVTDENRAEMRSAIQPLRAGRSTNLSEGWLTGCQEAATSAGEGILTRTLLLTDGMANAGITDLEELASHAHQLAVRGVSTSTFGVGHSFNEHLLEAMSNQGDGNFYYIESPADIPNLFLQEFQELSSVTVREVSIIIQLPPQIDVQVLGSWRSSCSEGVLRIDLGSLTPARPQEVYVRVLMPPAGQNEQIVLQAIVSGTAESGEKVQSEAEVIFRCATPQEVSAQPKRQEVLQRFASVEIADVATQALKLERLGEHARASKLLRQNVTANLPHMDGAQVDRYQQLADRMEHGMNEGDRKSTHFDTYNLKRRRDSQ
jgi:Ca-activated chloride channel homolog